MVCKILTPFIYNYWMDLWVLYYVEQKRQEALLWAAENPDEPGSDSTTFVSPDDRPLADILGSLF